MVRDELSSTNDEARMLAEDGAASGLVVAALKQTAGRGRRGAVWFAPVGESLAFSVMIRPQHAKSLWPRLALAAGLAVAEAIESFGIPTGIKWPNDVWIGQRKVAGILVEAGDDYAVVGIGLNVNSEGFPAEVAEIATSLKMEANRLFCLPDVLAAVVRRFAVRHQQIDRDFNDLLDSVRHRCVLTGNHIAFLTAAGPRTGLVHGIAAGGELQLRTADGIENLLQADEIRIINRA